MDLNNIDFGFPVALQPEPDETEIQKIGREIANLRSELVFIQNVGKTIDKKISELFSERSGKEKSYMDRIAAIQLEMQRMIQEMQGTISEARNEQFNNRKQYETKEAELDAKQKLYAKLLSERNSAELLAELTATVVELIGGTPAWQKARDYQKDVIFTAVQLYRDGKNGLLNADDMGLGKTYETILSLMIICILFYKDNGRFPTILWLTKKSLVSSTPREIRKWWDDKKVIPIKDIGSEEMREFALKTALKMDALVVTNYEFIRTTKLARNVKWDILVVDEVHKLKGGANASGPTAIWTAVKELALQTTFMFFLSGTPMVNSPMEMWSYLHIFSPERFPTLKAFRRDFCEKSKVAGEFDLVVNPDKLLQGALRGQMVRRRIDEVQIEMPDFEIEDRMLTMGDSQRKIYEDMRTKFFIWVDEQEGKTISAAAVIAQLNYLRQISVWPGMLHQVDDLTKEELKLDSTESVKHDEIYDLINDFQDQCIIGCTFNEPLYQIQRDLQKQGLTCEVLTGDNVSMTGEFEQRFQRRELDVFCMNIKMGAGMNLHKNPDEWRGGARYGITLDRWWSPADNDQFYRRIWRPGATSAVIVYDLYCESSVDFFIADILEKKRKEINSIAESSEVRPASEWKKYLEELI